MIAKRKARKYFYPFILKSISVLASLVIFSGFIFFILIYTEFFGPLPDKKDLADIREEQATLVYSSDGRMIGKIFAKNRTPVALDSFPDHLIDALIATEDSRFYEHNGIDGRSLIRVIIKSILMGNRSSGGGSTLTQQLAKNLYGRKNFGVLTLPVNKIREAILARRIEQVYSKDEILQLYLNSVPFGENVYGIEAAANRYFNKSVSELAPQESALLVGMLKGTTYYHPRLHPGRALQRRNMVLDLMKQQHKVSENEAIHLKSLPISLDYANYKREGPAQYFLFQVDQRSREILKHIEQETGTAYDIEKDGLKIITTLDSRLQEIARNAIRKQLSKMQSVMDRDAGVLQMKNQLKSAYDNLDKEKREIWDWNGILAANITRLDSAWHYYKMLQAGMLTMDPLSGKVRVWIGGNHFRFLPYDLVLSKRMIASAFKPILYATALEEGFDPCDYLDNEEKIYKKYHDWAPKNYDGTSGDEVAMWYALVHSMNLPTVDLYFKTGYQKLEGMCERLGISGLPKESPSIALGTIDLSLLNAVSVYASFANGGFKVYPVLIEEIRDHQGKIIYASTNQDTERVMDKETVMTLTTMLGKAVNEGTGTRLRTQYALKSELAGKTGTSQNFSDAWFFCYNPALVCGAWVGNRDPAIHFSSGSNGSGSALALPIIGQFLQTVEKQPELKKLYLKKFDIPQTYENRINCEGTRTKGAINRLFEKIFGDKEQDENKKLQKDTSNQHESKFKRFFKNLFGSKNK